jgi:hypothetical protein
VGFVEDKEALGHGFLRVLRFSTVSIIHFPEISRQLKVILKVIDFLVRFQVLTAARLIPDDGGSTHL